MQQCSDSMYFKNVGKEDKSHQDKEYARERVQENMRAITI